VAENLRPGGLAERLDDRVVERAADQDPRTSGAHFSLVEEEPHRDALDRRLCICVGEDDLRALASQLEDDTLERVRRGLLDRPTYVG